MPNDNAPSRVGRLTILADWEASVPMSAITWTPAVPVQAKAAPGWQVRPTCVLIDP
jgi:hypothetical protein